jgi:hypothetical protein
VITPIIRPSISDEQHGFIGCHSTVTSLVEFRDGSKPVMVQYLIGDSDLERVDLINDFGVLVDSYMTFVNHIRLCQNQLECWDL